LRKIQNKLQSKHKRISLLNKAEQLLRKSLKKARFRMREVKLREKLLPWSKSEARRRKAKNRRM
jgi:hypothetical protein